MAVDFIELLEVIEALPVDAFFETNKDGHVTEKDNIDAADFVDHSSQFMEAMRRAKHIKIQLEKET